MNQLSRCCNAKVKTNEREGFNFCDTCGRWMNKDNNPVRYPRIEDIPTPQPQRNEFSIMKFEDLNQTQAKAIQALITEARIEEVERIPNPAYISGAKRVEPMRDYKHQREAELQAQKAKV